MGERRAIEISFHRSVNFFLWHMNLKFQFAFVFDVRKVKHGLLLMASRVWYTERGKVLTFYFKVAQLQLKQRWRDAWLFVRRACYIVSAVNCRGEEFCHVCITVLLQSSPGPHSSRLSLQKGTERILLRSCKVDKLHMSCSNVSF